jgi:hypothetical protein
MSTTYESTGGSTHGSVYGSVYGSTYGSTGGSINGQADWYKRNNAFEKSVKLKLILGILFSYFIL